MDSETLQALQARRNFGKIVEEFCPELLLPPYPDWEHDQTYESIIIQDDNITLPSKEVFESRLAEYVNSIPWDALRQERNKLLAETDYLALTDYTISSEEKKQEWLTYRQALRDLPSNTTDPENPVWPTKPSN